MLDRFGASFGISGTCGGWIAAHFAGGFPRGVLEPRQSATGALQPAIAQYHADGHAGHGNGEYNGRDHEVGAHGAFLWGGRNLRVVIGRLGGPRTREVLPMAGSGPLDQYGCHAMAVRPIEPYLWPHYQQRGRQGIGFDARGRRGR